MDEFLNFQISLLDGTAQAFSGSDGQDLILGLGGSDTLQGFGGDDYINGNIEVDVIDGGDGNDTLRGGMNNDIMTGGAGDDTIFGDFGADTITGGAGSDRFVLGQGRGGSDATTTDIITDYTDGEDKIILEGTLTSSDLTIIQGGGEFSADTVVQRTIDGEILAILKNVTSSAIEATDFLETPAASDDTGDTNVTAVSSVGSTVNFAGVDVTSEAAVSALGGPSISVGNTNLYIGFEQVSANNQDPRLVSFTNGVQDWYRTDYEVTNDDSTGTGLVWDSTTDSLYATFTSTGTQGSADQDFREFATNGWLSSYGQGGGGQVAIVARIDPATGNVQEATFVSALLSNGNSNTLRVTGLDLNGDNVVVEANSFFSPRRTDTTAMEQTVPGGSPFAYTIEFVPDLSAAVRAEAPTFGS
ncbi:MAG: calcium-binding protein [Geitlerinemataceae cyanobacterium]